MRKYYYIIGFILILSVSFVFYNLIQIRIVRKNILNEYGALNGPYIIENQDKILENYSNKQLKKCIQLINGRITCPQTKNDTSILIVTINLIEEVMTRQKAGRELYKQKFKISSLLGRWDDALDALDEYILKDKKNWVALLKMGGVYEKLNESDSSLHYYNLANQKFNSYFKGDKEDFYKAQSIIISLIYGKDSAVSYLDSIMFYTNHNLRYYKNEVIKNFDRNEFIDKSLLEIKPHIEFKVKNYPFDTTISSN